MKITDKELDRNYKQTVIILRKISAVLGRTNNAATMALDHLDHLYTLVKEGELIQSALQESLATYTRRHKSSGMAFSKELALVTLMQQLVQVPVPLKSTLETFLGMMSVASLDLTPKAKPSQLAPAARLLQQRNASIGEGTGLPLDNVYEADELDILENRN